MGLPVKALADESGRRVSLSSFLLLYRYVIIGGSKFCNFYGSAGSRPTLLTAGDKGREGSGLWTLLPTGSIRQLNPTDPHPARDR
jgi:hypothetical protein